MTQSVKYGITVVPKASYLADQSDPSKDHYVFSYTITITNTGEVAAQLVSRHWIITDADGDVQEVRGPGVVGETPVLAPGQAFEYTSFCPLPTPVGTMQGTYSMVTADGETFDAAIAPFTLAMPYALN